MQAKGLTQYFLLFLLTLPLPAHALPHQAYVWQRVWRTPLKESIAAYAEQLDGLTCLAAEITPNAQGDVVVFVPLDYALLSSLSAPVTLAVRVGAYPGPFSESAATSQALLRTVETVIHDARKNHLQLAAIEIDFDCATSKLSGYRNWLNQLRGSLQGVPLSITALPTWMSEPDAFAELTQAADHFVLQVHSIQRPMGPGESVELCNPKQALRWVDQANAFWRPFHVALPTYSYELAFDGQGALAQVRGENATAEFNTAWRYERVSADPLELATLVRDLEANMPTFCQGVIWYRLPVDGERLNWDAATWRSVMQGEAPPPLWQTLAVPQPDGSIEIQVRQISGIATIAPQTVTAKWSAAEAVAWDGQRHYDVELSSTNSLTWRRTGAASTMRPDETWTLGWVRLNQPANLELTIHP